MNNVRLILCRPQNAGNIGSCARLSSNFAVHDCALVSPLCDVESLEAEKMATPNAAGLLKELKIKNSLKEAIADCQLSVGFTRRGGEMRRPTLTLAEVASRARESKVALIFGNERTGLDAGELALCSHACFIPTDGANPSLNLSHAVAIVLARLYESNEPSRTESLKTSERSELRELEALMTHWSRYLEATGFVDNQNPERILKKLRKIFGRAELSKSEVALLHGLLHQGHSRITGKEPRH
ncbi:MAG TPA: TrmH family RNA methyltransferase [Bdellovibrionales bacterium]|nr:TrmH family RNA methyltransferase [Bdellovibrionales bacterium]